MGKVHLEIITPEKVLISQDVDSVTAPGTFGEFGVLEDHITFLSGIVPGELHYTNQGETKRPCARAWKEREDLFRSPAQQKVVP